MTIYSLADLRALQYEYLQTLDDDNKDEHYTTDRTIADDVLWSFFGWLNIRENTP